MYNLLLLFMFIIFKVSQKIKLYTPYQLIDILSKYFANV
ncbi:hypothetical protein IBB3154_1481 [Ligilactobacillus salivarius]|nr:hypothetical protein IBB3154_1481 [Ligilactobacillus salivarius]